MEFARKNCINNGNLEGFCKFDYKQTNYRQICLFYISWLNYMFSKMLLLVISKPYMVSITRLCHSVLFFCDSKYQKFLTRVFFRIHISTCFCWVFLIFLERNLCL